MLPWFRLCKKRARDDQVYQGTVLGPVLWNTFFADVAGEASKDGGQEAMFADDLNVFKRYTLDTSNEDAILDMEITRTAVHKWGIRNRVTFAGIKEHIIVLHPSVGQGDVVKLLGCLIDPKLTMTVAIY